MSTPALEASHISVHYGQFLAVEDVSISIDEGECVALIGPNGHGKSSFVNAISGLVRRGGTLKVFGTEIPPTSPPAAVAAGVILVPEHRYLYPGLSTRDNIMLGSYTRTSRIRADRAWRDVSGLLDMFPELSRLLDQRAGSLSGGQQQMVALARAMAGRPRILILDEPCLGLAEAVSQRVYNWLRSVINGELTVLLVEENPVHALEVSNRAVRIYQGLVDSEPLAQAAGE
jgi:branched-chain amino acid transport system ATP-binding protein